MCGRSITRSKSGLSPPKYMAPPTPSAATAAIKVFIIAPVTMLLRYWQEGFKEELPRIVARFDFCYSSRRRAEREEQHDRQSPPASARAGLSQLERNQGR